MKQLLTAIGLIVGGLVLLSQVGCQTLKTELMPSDMEQLNTKRQTVKLAAGRLDFAAAKTVDPDYARAFQVNLTVLVLGPNKHRALIPKECKQQCIKCWGSDCIVYIIGGTLPDGSVYAGEFTLGHEVWHYINWRENLNSDPDRWW